MVAVVYIHPQKKAYNAMYVVFAILCNFCYFEFVSIEGMKKSHV